MGGSTSSHSQTNRAYIKEYIKSAFPMRLTDAQSEGVGRYLALVIGMLSCMYVIARLQPASHCIELRPSRDLLV
jgi:hypothetical protein